jgi:glycosyltransferase involved in cell wall biosynthesis
VEGEEEMSEMDVVVPTLMRKTLPYCLQAIFEVIPEPIIHLITDKGLTTGEFRNKGLMECRSEYTVFVDDDVIVNKNWYEQCMKKLLDNPNLIVAGGRFEHGLTLGCIICRTKAFQQIGGFPRMDCYIERKLGDRCATVDVVCQHIHPKLDMVFRQFYNIVCDFQTESKTGTGNNPKQAMQNFFLFLYWKQPEAAISQPLWIIKSVFCLPFLLNGKKKIK